MANPGISLARPMRHGPLITLLRTFHRPIVECVFAAAIVFGASAICIASLYFKANTAQVSAVRAELERLARQAAAQVDPHLHHQLDRPEQMDTPLYEEALRPLAAFHRSIPDIFYVYTMVMRDEQLFFVLDTSNRPQWIELDRKMEPSALMDSYEKPPCKSGNRSSSLL